MRLSARGFAVQAVVISFAAACGGAVARPMLNAPAYNPPDQTKCRAAASPTKPLVVEWPSTARGELEALVEEKKTVAVVRYEGCTMSVLAGCTAPGAVKYVPYRNTKKDRLRITNADDLYASLPVGAAKLEGKLASSGELDVDMTLVGEYEADVDTAPEHLQGGAQCAGATHIVRAARVGALRACSARAGAAARRRRKRTSRATETRTRVRRRRWTTRTRRKTAARS
jgi:hypothetical protein